MGQLCDGSHGSWVTTDDPSLVDNITFMIFGVTRTGSPIVAV